MVDEQIPYGANSFKYPTSIDKIFDFSYLPIKVTLLETVDFPTCKVTK